MDIFNLFLVAFLLLFGVSTFVNERVLVVLAGICAIVAGVVGLVRLVG